ncbi:phytoene desaturase family protein [Corynebacterium sp. HS2168-gen11]|uniref:phytoene desaturase family protein n=1 Tax=Corynebacterium sp. HS2168-gen11 TaxID=2974027 RepID=UPI00216B58A3|nr:phytoene desaturase family protein [Corynebacterium sp. HS2168-gen11]MCS4535389.1 phytoene desaturase family protein [Corynebacterium sp. HS2168-gen11]
MRIVVIGAGFSGLATAALLAHYGHTVTVVEKNSEAGGRSGSLAIDGFRFDTGPSWYLMPDAFEHFFRLLGTSVAEQLELVQLDPGYRIFPEGHEPVDVPADPAKVLELFESIEPGAGMVLEDYLRSAADIYQRSIDRFLYTTFSNASFIRPSDLLKLPRLLVQSMQSFVNRQFHDTRLRQILTYPSVFLASHPKRTPALYHLMSHTDLTQGVFYPVGGFHAIVNSIASIAKAKGVTFIYDAAVERIAHDAGVVTGVYTDDRFIAADAVVSSADLFHTEQQLLDPDVRSYSASYFKRRDPGLSAVLVLLGVRDKIEQLTHHNLIFSKDWGPDFAAVFEHDPAQQASRSIYISMPSATDAGVAPAGDENIFILIPTAADPSIGDGSAYGDATPKVEAIADAAIQQLAEIVPDLEQRIVVRRTIGPKDFVTLYHSHQASAIGPAHTLRQSAFFRGRNMSRKIKGLYYAGATTVPGVGVPMCLISAENIVKRIHGDRSHGRLKDS